MVLLGPGLNAQLVVTIPQFSGEIGRPLRFDRFEHLLASPAVERWVRKKADRTRYTYLNRLDALLPQIEKDTGAKTPDEFVIMGKGP